MHPVSAWCLCVEIMPAVFTTSTHDTVCGSNIGLANLSGPTVSNCRIKKKWSAVECCRTRTKALQNKFNPQVECWTICKYEALNHYRGLVVCSFSILFQHCGSTVQCDPDDHFGGIMWHPAHLLHVYCTPTGANGGAIVPCFGLANLEDIGGKKMTKKLPLQGI